MAPDAAASAVDADPAGLVDLAVRVVDDPAVADLDRVDLVVLAVAPRAHPKARDKQRVLTVARPAATAVVAARVAEEDPAAFVARVALAEVVPSRADRGPRAS